MFLEAASIALTLAMRSCTERRTGSLWLPTQTRTQTAGPGVPPTVSAGRPATGIPQPSRVRARWWGRDGGAEGKPAP